MTTQEVLKKQFGYDTFRDGQEALVDALVSGRDALGIMPTGAGKSVCYQVPALVMPGIALVISPLISLMKDQVASLKASGVAAAFLNSSLTASQQLEALRRAALGWYQIMYVAPERLDVPEFIQFATQAQISLVAVDEAHCVSQWGQDFRPSYLKIPDFVDRLPQRPPVGAFTATATPQVKADIVKLLRLREPCSVVTGFDRPNLRFSVTKPGDKYAALCRVIRKHPERSGVVYCATRKDVEKVCENLCMDGFSATRYHAGLSDEERRRNQDDFQYDRSAVMVATNAFGMGIDKSNVSYVVHYAMPKNLESYYQEAGRAGRDGSDADCVLLYSGRDYFTAKWMIEHSDENTELDDEHRELLRRRDMQRLKQMTDYSTTAGCLRRFILNYFGETAPEECGNCSSCLGLEEWQEQENKVSKRTLRDSLPVEDMIYDEALFLRLKGLRSRVAKQRGIPPYAVFTDATLRDMARMQPQSGEELLRVSGVGEAKRKQYGEAFLRVLRGDQEEEQTENAKQASARNQKWSAEEDGQLRREFELGASVSEMSRTHGRTKTAIWMRMRKLNLTEDA